MPPLQQSPAHKPGRAPAPADGLAIVTGATGGLGFEIALCLARAGFETLLTGRDRARGTAATAKAQADLNVNLGAGKANGSIRFALLDVSSLANVEAFASTIHQPVAVLVNNAGVMALPQRELTIDGFERQIGTNYLGHFALTARLLPHLQSGRVVNVSSVAHRRGRINFNDLQGAVSYSPWAAYAQSKLAMLMFGLELQKRSAAGAWGVTGLAAHPGWSATQLVQNGPGRKQPGLVATIMQAGFSALSQSAANGALPELYAALDPGARPGGYYGPCCLGETRGRPTPARIMPQAQNEADRARLWELSETLTGVSYSL